MTQTLTWQKGGVPGLVFCTLSTAYTSVTKAFQHGGDMEHANKKVLFQI